jgi:XTP/dITP diphosphohydrolase
VGSSILIVSSRNPDKLRELRALLAPLDIELRSAAEAGVPDVEETGTTFLDNALLKAAAAWGATGAPSLADDSGLAVEALGGAPGVRSARFAGERADYADNNRHLLERLAGVPDTRRGAAFVCTLALLLPAESAPPATAGAAWRTIERDDVPAGTVLVAIEGRVEGRILHAARGEGGFGYDPLFLHEPSGQTFSELSAEAKHAISHRGRAFAGLRACLEAVSRR